MKNGNTDRAIGSGRKRKTSDSADRLIVLQVKRNRFTTAEEIREATGLENVSNKTIRRRIFECSEFASYWAVRKPFISENNRKKRVQWCLEHRDWTVEQWRKVIWTDESPYVLRFNCSQRVWRSANERYDKKCILASVKHDQKLMVWGCFTAHGVGDLHRIVGIMDKHVYHSVLVHHFRPSANRLFPNGDYIFQQDNDPKHTAIINKDYVKNKNIPTMRWPAQSPDLNPIENLWSILDRRLKDRKVNTLDELFKTLQDGWNKLDTDLLTRLCDSMPHRIEAVLHSKGMPTKY